VSWQPDGEERRYVECTASMTLDTLRADGVADRATFIANLRAIANGLERIAVLEGTADSEEP